MLPVLSDWPCVQWCSLVYCSGYTVMTSPKLAHTHTWATPHKHSHTRQRRQYMHSHFRAGLPKYWECVIRMKTPETIHCKQHKILTVRPVYTLDLADFLLFPQSFTSSYSYFMVTLLCIWSCCTSCCFQGNLLNGIIRWYCIELWLSYLKKLLSCMRTLWPCVLFA